MKEWHAQMTILSTFSRKIKEIVFIILKRFLQVW